MEKKSKTDFLPPRYKNNINFINTFPSIRRRRGTRNKDKLTGWDRLRTSLWIISEEIWSIPVNLPTSQSGEEDDEEGRGSYRFVSNRSGWWKWVGLWKRVLLRPGRANKGKLLVVDPKILPQGYFTNFYERGRGRRLRRRRTRVRRRPRWTPGPDNNEKPFTKQPQQQQHRAHLMFCRGSTYISANDLWCVCGIQVVYLCPSGSFWLAG